MNEKTTTQTMLSHISTATGLRNATALQRRLSASGKSYLIVLNDPEAESYFVATVAETCALIEAGYELLNERFVGTLPALLARLAEWGVQDVDLSGSDQLCLNWCYAARRPGTMPSCSNSRSSITPREAAFTSATPGCPESTLTAAPLRGRFCCPSRTQTAHHHARHAS